MRRWSRRIGGRVAKRQTLLQLAVRRVGLMRAGRVLAFMVAWDVVRRELDREPTLEEYGDWWRQSRATSFREQKLFREAFPGEVTPTRLLDAAGDEWDRRRGWKGLGAVPARDLAPR